MFLLSFKSFYDILDQIGYFFFLGTKLETFKNILFVSVMAGA